MATSDPELQLNIQWETNNDQLRELNVNKDVKELNEMGGVEGVARLLRADVHNGLAGDEVDDKFAERQRQFGPNVLDEPPMESLLSMIWGALKEPILILLVVAAIVSLVFGIFFPKKGQEKTDWIEGFAILVAIALVVGVTAGNDYQKELKFRSLNKIKNDRLVKVRRAGKEDNVSIDTIQVGDLVILATGDQIPADGLFIDGYDLSADESVMTGEPDSVKKNKSKPYLLSGCQVTTGSGTMLVTAVGMNSAWGITYKELIVPREPTPLQEKLGTLAKLIGYLGMVVAGVLFVALTIKFIVVNVQASHNGTKFEGKQFGQFINFFILCVTIVVVAVPEGLPLAVTIALAYSMRAMLKDNNLVRHLAACETMGGATNICSDKTGTLTENLMTVTQIYIGGNLSSDLDETLRIVDKGTIELLCNACDTNSNGFLKYNDSKKRFDFIGNKTECALLVMSNKFGHEYDKVRKAHSVITLFPFSSERKRMSTLVDHESGSRLFAKGASEIILGQCTSYVDSNGKIVPLVDSEIDNIQKIIESLASEGLRTLSIAYKDINSKTDEYDEPPESALTLIAIVGIKDPLRKEVPGAIQICKEAGIIVRMVTGDNKLTATKIAQDCGILEEGGMVMEGPVFRKLTNAELDKILPNLRVLARSSPTDKHRLVTRLRFHREVVAVTGDGTNDGPALKAADVGFAMGIAGTEIAKEASDIIIMDDNFASIVKAVMWGRSVRQAIQKFLQFQMTVNAVALVIAFISAISGHGEPLKPIQLLWVNLIQDTFAALALATEKPTEAMLKEKPTGRRDRLITPVMWRNIFAGSIYSLVVLMPMVYAGQYMFRITEDAGQDLEEYATIRFTVVFNAFVLLACFNEINARRLDNHWNVFENFFSNLIFLGVVVGTAAAQVIIVSIGSIAFGVVYLNYKYWFICLIIGLSMLPFGVISRVCIPVPDFDWLKYEKVVAQDEADEDQGEIITKADKIAPERDETSLHEITSGKTEERLTATEIA